MGMPEKTVKEVPHLGGLMAKELGRLVIHEVREDDGFGRAVQLWTSSSAVPAIYDVQEGLPF
jgi:hypothetical protein